ncbi:MAG: WG repeat-containing protein [Tannerella sp.]|jgi:hypothetical protein|nr:WG repeat-containing protein [Tannerella sp.]
MKKIGLLTVLSCLLLASCGGGSSVSELIPLSDGNKFVYFNSKGEEAVQPVQPGMDVTETSLFRDGLATVEITTEYGSGYGFLNTKGEVAIEAKYKHATAFNDGLAWVVETNGAPKAINRKGEEVFSLPEAEMVLMFTEGLAAFLKKDSDGNPRFGYVDKKGKVVIEPFYATAQPFSNGLAAVSIDKKFGYINRKGEMVIPEQFESADFFTDGGLAVAGISDKKQGVIDQKGTFVLNPKYESVTIDGNEFLVEENGKQGIVDKNGKTVIPMDFKKLYPFYGGKYSTASMDGKKYGIVDRKGKFTVNPQFDFAFSFIGDVAVVRSGKQIGLVDTDGKYVVNPRYETISMDLALFSFPVSANLFAESDWLDMDAIVSAVVGNESGGAYRGISASSTYSTVKAIHPKLSSSIFSSTHTSGDDIPLSGDVYITSVAFTFNGPTSKREYDHYERQYMTVELDPAVKTAAYEIRFRSDRAQKKASDIADAISSAINSRYTDGGAAFEVSRSSTGIEIKVVYPPKKTQEQ